MSTNTKQFVRKIGRWVHDHPDGWLNLIGAVIGVLTAIIAIGFAWTLSNIEHLTEDLQSMIQGENGTRLWLIPLVPMMGAFITGVLVFRFAPKAAGHGVPHVLDAIVRKGGKIPVVNGVVKVIASICTVGSGGSAGAEGPIVQAGSVIGSVIAQRLGLGVRLGAARQRVLHFGDGLKRIPLDKTVEAARGQKNNAGLLAGFPLGVLAFENSAEVRRDRQAEFCIHLHVFAALEPLRVAHDPCPVPRLLRQSPETETADRSCCHCPIRRPRPVAGCVRLRAPPGGMSARSRAGSLGVMKAGACMITALVFMGS